MNANGDSPDVSGNGQNAKAVTDAPQEETVKPPAEDARGGFGGRWGAVGMPLERSKDFKNSTRRLAARLRPEGLGVAGVLILAVSSVSLAVIAPRILGSATNVIPREF